MTSEQAETLKKFAMQAMPKSSEAQGRVLHAAIEQFPEDLVADAIVKHAAESEFISTLAIMTRIRGAMGGGAYERWQAAARESDRKREQITDLEDPSVTQARTFCRDTAPEQLAAWRAEIEAVHPALAVMWRGKETLSSISIVCAVHQKFGKIPRECWVGGAA